MKNLEEIDEEFNSLLEIESKKFKTKLADFKNRAKVPIYEKEFKKKISLLLKKKEKEIAEFVSKHGDKLFPAEDRKKEEKKKEGPKYLDVKHLDMKLSRKERINIKRSIKKFKLKIWWSNFYYHIIPAWIFFRLFKLRFRISNFFRGFRRSFGYFLRRRGKKLVGFFKKFALGIKNIYEKVIKLWKKFIGLFVKKKKEGEEEKEKKEGEQSEELEKKEIFGGEEKAEGEKENEEKKAGEGKDFNEKESGEKE